LQIRFERRGERQLDRSLIKDPASRARKRSADDFLAVLEQIESDRVGEAAAFGEGFGVSSGVGASRHAEGGDMAQSFKDDRMNPAVLILGSYRKRYGADRPAQGKAKVALMKNDTASRGALNGRPTRGHLGADLLEFLETAVGYGGFGEAEEAQGRRAIAALNARQRLGIDAHVFGTRQGRSGKDSPSFLEGLCRRSRMVQAGHCRRSRRV
jgi:hypothetical protein